MGAWWIGVAVAAVAVASVAIGVLRRRPVARGPDVGAVSDGWLAEERGRKDS
jgi:hypothetical protein